MRQAVGSAGARSPEQPAANEPIDEYRDPGSVLRPYCRLPTPENEISTCTVRKTQETDRNEVSSAEVTLLAETTSGI